MPVRQLPSRLVNRADVSPTGDSPQWFENRAIRKQKTQPGIRWRLWGLAVAALLSGCVRDLKPFSEPPEMGNAVGRVGLNRYLTPTGQVLTPAGRQVELPGLRPQALALSPDGKLLAVAGGANTLILIDPATGLVLQSVRLSTVTSKPKSAFKPAGSGAAGDLPPRARPTRLPRSPTRRR